MSNSEGVGNLRNLFFRDGLEEVFKFSSSIQIDERDKELIKLHRDILYNTVKLDEYARTKQIIDDSDNDIVKKELKKRETFCENVRKDPKYHRYKDGAIRVLSIIAQMDKLIKEKEKIHEKLVGCGRDNPRRVSL